jgi:predicted murein hydrolase (TIGR00659 family)
MDDLHELWVYLSTSPLLHLTLTLVAYQIGMFIYRRGRFHPMLNPVLISVVLIVAVLTATRTSYAVYFDGAQFVHFLLGPATVALAVPLYRQFHRVRQSGLAILVSLSAGSLTGATSAVVIAWMLGASHTALVSIAPKSVTAPVAMGIAEQLGGLPSLTAVVVIISGILGAMIGPILLDKMGITDWAARGLAIGTASHGIGTARAVQDNEIAGAFSGLAMGLNALATAILLPIIWRLLFAG